MYKFNFFQILQECIKAIFFMGREPMLVALWFLIVLFFTAIGFNLIGNLSDKFESKEKIRAILVFLFFSLGVICNCFNLNIPRISNAFSALIFYYFGFIYKTYEKKINFFTFNGRIVIILCFIFLMISNNFTEVFLVSNTYTDPFSFLNGCVGICLILMISNRISQNVKNERIKFLIDYVGKNTKIIMALHVISFKLVDFAYILITHKNIDNLSSYMVLNKNSIIFIIYTIVGVFIPILFQSIVEKISKYLKILCEEKNK